MNEDFAFRPGLKARIVSKRHGGAIATTQVMRLDDPDPRTSTMRVDAYFRGGAIDGHGDEIEILDLETGKVIGRTRWNQRVRQGDAFTASFKVAMAPDDRAFPVPDRELSPLQVLDREVGEVCAWA